MVERWNITFPAEDGEEERSLYVYLPTSYYHSDQRYPVLYMFDGHNVFFDSDATYGKSWGLGDYLDNTQTQLIVAAVECSHSPSNGRLREYCPYTFSDPQLGKIVGTGEATMEWMKHVLKPMIDERLRTLPDRAHTWIGGSSMGGLMSLYALLCHNETFSRAAALSPSLWTSPAKIKAMIKNAKIGPESVLYLDYGEKELSYRDSMAETLGASLRLLLKTTICTTSRIVPGGTHCEASWEKQLPFAIPTLTYAM